MNETFKRICSYGIGVVLFLGISVLSFLTFQYIIDLFDFSMETLNILGIGYFIVYVVVGIPSILVLLRFLKHKYL